MAGSKADGFENDVLKAATGQATTILSTTPITAYLALFTSDPTDAGTAGTEATGGGYARITTAGKWGAPSGGVVSNDAQIAFAQFSGTVSAGAPFTHFMLITHLSNAPAAGNVLYVGTLTDQTKTGANGDTIVFNIGQLTLTET